MRVQYIHYLSHYVENGEGEGEGTMGGDENVTIVVKYRRLGNFKVEL